MPPFRLELPDYIPQHALALNLRMIYKKNEYHPTVKITDWNERRDCLPFDNDPFCPGAVDHTISHYNAFGTSPKERLSTTTRDMWEQIYTKSAKKYNVPVKKYLVNYLGYNDLLPCDIPYEAAFCTEDCMNNWNTTMQDSYTPPHPFCMKPLSVPVLPFLKYRKLKQEDPFSADYKFYDEELIHHICLLNKYKGDRHASFNPFTLSYTGEDDLSSCRKCFSLEYDTDRDIPTKCYSNRNNFN